jgi:hypothetical protein
MRKKKKIDDLAITVAKSWQKFRNSMAEYFDMVDEVYVDLKFESSYDPKTHYNFDSDEALFPRDIEISPLNKVIITVPYGTGRKSFTTQEAELIVANKAGETQPLNQVIDQEFLAAFADIEGVDSIEVFEKKFLNTEPKLAEVLNNVDDFLRLHALQLERANKYSKLPQYGLF